MEYLEKNGNPVTEEEVVDTPETGTENVEQTTEQTPRTYTEEEFEAELNARVNKKLDEVLPGKIARRENKIRKEYERKYGEFESVIRTGTGKQNESIEEITGGLRQFYGKKGVKFPEKPNYSDQDIAVLAKADAEDIIRGGYEDVVEEVERLAEVGFDNMTQREKAVFKTLAEHRIAAERGIELSKIGVTEDVYNSKEFTDFAGQFASNVPITKVYEIYKATQPKKNIKSMGSMKATAPEDNGVKDFYTFEEASKFTKKDFDNNPALFQKVQESMRKWK